MKNFYPLTFSLFLLIYLIPFSLHAAPPSGLMTDLLEHTDRIWVDGYESQLVIPQLDTAKTIERRQFPYIHTQQPQFSWIVNDTRADIKQSAYQVMVATDKGLLDLNQPDCWNSDWVFSDNSVSVLYAGEPLKAGTTYYWKVRTENNGLQQGWSDVKAFRTGDKLSEYRTAVYPLEKYDEIPITSKSLPDGGHLYDFGKASFAQLKVTIDNVNGLDTVLVRLGEALQNGRIDQTPGGTIRYQEHKLAVLPGYHTYYIKIPAGGRNTRTTPPLAIAMPDYIGEVYPFRYCEIDGVSRPNRTVMVMRQTVTYPYNDQAAYFHSSDGVLNQVWDLCEYSVKATTFAGIYVDGDRERIPYEADALLNQLCHYSVDREYSIARASHEYLLYNATWPTEWILQSVLIAWYDYLYTGDIRSVRAHYELLQRKTMPELEDENGFIWTENNPAVTPAFKDGVNLPHNQTLRDITDWPRDRFVFTPKNISPNSFRYASLGLLSKMAEALGYDQDARMYARKANQLKDNINKYFYDKKSGLYRDGIGTDSVSLYSNMFPVALGVAEPESFARIAAYMVSRGMECSVYAAQFLMEALYETGQADAAFALLTSTDMRSWYNMIRAGSTISTEAWDIALKPNQDWNHVWGAVPANIIPRKLMGIEPIEPGFRRVRIKPQPGGVTNATYRMPSIRGNISVTLANLTTMFQLDVEMPANMVGDIYLPIPRDTHAKTMTVEMDGKISKNWTLEGNFIKFASVGSGPHRFLVKK